MGDVVFIISVPPTNCPNCNYLFRWDNLAKEDFYARAAHSCPRCGARFQYVSSASIIVAAKKEGGDL